MHRAPTGNVMMDKPEFDATKHHRRSIRLPHFDYAQPGGYFITICTHNRSCLFGDVINGEMILNEYGIAARDEWLKTLKIRENIKLDEFVIMPNHIHGIIRILERKGTMHRAPTDDRASTLEQFGKPTSNTIPNTVRGYKSAVTNQINIVRRTPGLPVWQRNYYERVIRHEKELSETRQYIINNPVNWEMDENYPVVDLPQD